MLHGWRRKDGAVYYADRRSHRSHVPYTDEHSGTAARLSDVVVHSFELTGGCRIPVPVLRAFASSGRADWDLPTSMKGSVNRNG